MTSVTYDLLDESFFTKSSYVYHLHIVFADDACSYLIYDEEQLLAYRSYDLGQQNRALFSWKDELQTLMHQDKMLQLVFKSVKIFLLHSQFTFVPNELFEVQNTTSYLSKIAPNVESDLVNVESLLNGSLKNIFSLKIDLHQFAKKQYENVLFSHSLSFLIENFKKDAKNDTKLYLNFHQKQIQIVFFKEGNFHFANNFTFQTSADIAYYMMLVINQFQLNPELVQIVLSGHIEKNTEAYNTIIKYVRNISFLDYSVKKAKHRIFQEVPNHLFVNIL